MYNIYVIYIALYLVSKSDITKGANIVVKKIEYCQKDSPVNISTRLYTEGKKQYLDTNITIPFNVDDNYGMTLYVEQSSDGLTYFPIANIRDKKACKAANRYLGEVWHSIQKDFQMEPGVCPVKSGTYWARHYELDFTNFMFPLPAGHIKSVANLYDKRNKKGVFCQLIMVDVI